MLLEADTLGALDVHETKPFFDAASNRRYMQGVKKKRRPKFLTAYGKEQFEKLFAERNHFYQQKR
ncbi:hypothetical protein LRY65_02000 [Candidatus Woesebacteria bacterium]|nr:hypothetical protein [Candidatus Woesebacteria bacterium]MCD8507778.1 hypothetical protein [Candidatus Woesebacteria bacterium]MCD8526965.1 hypothetical protein [Candidatus Woesebacteria bacterium]MCD8545864.1 hypothetical protein [Candidatus Woesebacteria bacterium]